MHRLVDMLNEWLNPRYLDPDVLSQVRERFWAAPRQLVSLENVWRPDYANAVSQQLASLRYWNQVNSLMADVRAETKVYEVGPAAWLAAEENARWARHDIARPLTKLAATDATDAGPAPELLAFIELVCVTDQFRGWLGRLLGVELGQRVTCELARYRAGDYIRPHSDTHDGRTVGVNFYFDRAWQPEDGCFLRFVNAAGEEHLAAPRFNSLTLLPIQPGCLHSVQPRKTPGPGRHTVSLSYTAVYRQASKQPPCS